MNTAKKLTLGLLRGAGSGGAAAITYLFRDEFTTAEGAPAASPMTAEPGPGTSTLVQVDGSFARNAGTLVVTGQTTAADGDLSIATTTAENRLAGRTMFCTVTRTAGTQIYAGVGWFRANNAVTDGNREHSFHIANASTFRASTIVTAEWNIGEFASATEYTMAIVLRTVGALFFIKGGAYTAWTLVWTADRAVGTPLYAGVGAYDASATLDDLSIRDLPAPFETDYGITTLNVASPVDATEYTGDADALIELGVTAPGTLDGSSTTRCGFYYRADSDLTPAWHCYVDGTGAFNIDSIAADGTRTNRVAVAASITGGAFRKLRVACLGAKQSGWYATTDTGVWTARGTQISVSLNDAATRIIPSVPAGWAVTNLRCYPRTSSAYAVLDPN